MPILHVPFPPTRSRASREQLIGSNYPNAEGAIRNFFRTLKPIKYGVAPLEIEKKYHFVPYRYANEYYSSYFSELGLSDEDSKAKIREHLEVTINRITLTEPSTTSEMMELVSGNIIEKILKYSKEGNHFARIVIGATGSGKSAFSKSLISFSIHAMWENGIIPSRVEYKKFENKNKGFVGDDLLFYTRQCQLRDLFIYLACCPNRDLTTNLELIRSCSGDLVDTPLLNSISTYFKEAANFLERSSWTLRDVHRLWKARVGLINDQSCIEILRKIHKSIRVRYLVSFDGFDVITVDDFIFNGLSSTPIQYLSELLNKKFANLTGHGMNQPECECHYLLYIRDTTYQRLKAENVTAPSCIKALPRYWIVPPMYKSLVNNAAVAITGVEDFNINGAKKLYLDIDSLYAKTLSENKEGNSSLVFSLFSGNARLMKRHIVRLLLWCLEHEGRRLKTEFERTNSGVDPAWLWKKLVESGALSNMPSYHVLEELFLDDYRQLCPPLRIDGASVASCLISGNLTGAFGHVGEYSEREIGFLDSVFNYVLKKNLRDIEGEECLPALLLQVRILQYLQTNPGRSKESLAFFLDNIGYQLSKDELNFIIYCLIRSELIIWDAGSSRITIQDIPLYIGTKGALLISKAIFSVTYFSESLIASELPLSGMSSLLKGRESNVGSWVLDSVFNTILGIKLIEDIEKYEMECAQINGVEFLSYKLVDKLEKNLCAEMSRITLSPVGRNKRRWEAHYSELATMPRYNKYLNSLKRSGI